MDAVRRTLQSERQGSFYAIRALSLPGWRVEAAVSVQAGRAAPHFLFSCAANPAPTGRDV